MQIPLSDAKAHLSDLARRAEAGEEIILTRHGRPAVRLVAVRQVKSTEERRAAINAIMDEGERRWLGAGLGAARSQDYLYDENGLPA
jgi:prevent-host-death family protein